MGGDDELQPRERARRRPCKRDPLPPRVQVEVEFVDEHCAFHSRGRLGPIELVEHDGAAGDVGDERDVHVVAVGKLGPRGDVPVVEAHLRDLAATGSYQAFITPGRRLDRRRP